MRILFVSNRLPIIVERTETGWSSHAGSGGLVTALVPVLKRWGGVWIGWPGVADADGASMDKLFADFAHREGYSLAAVPLTPEDYERFYEGFCNEIIWPLFHDLQTNCKFKPEYWTSCLKVEQAFAQVVQRTAQPDDLIWVQDYHLMGLGKALFNRGLRNKLAFFLHIPFPPPDIFCKLPWRMEVLDGLMHYKVIGLQSQRDLKNFSDCVHKLLPGVEQRLTSRQSRMQVDGRTCDAGVFPIGIDFDEFAAAAAEPAVEQRVSELRQSYPNQQILLGVDRLDYTKGVPHRLESFALALERFPNLHRAVTLIQVVVPSREGVSEYKDLKAEIEHQVAQINGKFTQPGWVPVHYIFRHVQRNELLAWYRLADVALVTSLKDGMNLVAKEYCACQIDENGVLVLSEFAGASEQLGQWAVMVNPYDFGWTADAIQLAVMMSPEERRPAMRKLRTNVREQNVHWWLSQCLKVCGVHLEHTPAGVPITAL